MMRKNKFFVATAVLLAVSMALVSCGGNGPKPLAKQTYQLMLDTAKAGEDVKKAADLAAKALKLQEKIDNLSKANTAAYQEELARLMAGASASLGAAVTTGSDGKKYVSTQKDADFKYDLTADGTGVVITGMNKPTNGDYYNVIKIPAKIEGYPVVEVRQFNSQAAKLSVSFPDTVTTLGEKLFNGREMSSVKLPPKITVIPRSLFSSAKITEITIPNGVTRIEDDAFFDCKQLTTVTIPDSVTEIEYGAFRVCPELTTVKLPSHPIQYLKRTDYPDKSDTVVRKIGTTLFPSTVLVLKPDNDAFSGCGKLSLAMRKAIQDSGYTGTF
jgi:hypothetical protein